MPVAETKRALDRRATDLALHAKGAEPKPRQADALGLQMVHDNSSGINAAGMSKPAMPRERAFRGRMDETAYPPFDSLPATQGPNQDQVRGVMVRALRRWLE